MRVIPHHGQHAACPACVDVRVRLKDALNELVCAGTHGPCLIEEAFRIFAGHHVAQHRREITLLESAVSVRDRKLAHQIVIAVNTHDSPQNSNHYGFAAVLLGEAVILFVYGYELIGMNFGLRPKRGFETVGGERP